MKIKALFLALFVAGLGASLAIAKPPPGHGKNKGDAATTANAAGSTTAALPTSGKVTLCHKTGNATHWVRVSVSVHAATKRLAKGDVWLKDANGTCVGAAAKQKGGDENDDGDKPATTTAATTTAAATTAAATTAAATTTAPSTTTTGP